jgi:hypothetical protein
MLLEIEMLVIFPKEVYKVYVREGVAIPRDVKAYQ